MLILDTLLIGGLKFIFRRIAEAVDAELNDEGRLREELLAAEMRVELGEMTAAEFAELEQAIHARIRAIRQGSPGEAPSPGRATITGVEATVWSDESEDDNHPSRPSRR